MAMKLIRRFLGHRSPTAQMNAAGEKLVAQFAKGCADPPRTPEEWAEMHRRLDEAMPYMREVAERAFGPLDDGDE
ncbi:hypothetical protein [Streptomyces lydicus]|uniref:hypothetical protein n=1 Tax=Streptomyces lydicus TaxID=47763 RepID=UPI001010F12A|nr:hypothetical protein [Streptomyces lydicus]MCZ1006327.1 hypothetical protein [Streptomyces lydicus]